MLGLLGVMGVVDQSDSLQAAEGLPVARWDFGSEEPEPLVTKGSVLRDQPGPRPPEFPDLDPDNMAVQLKGNGARFEIQDPGPESRFDFTNGDAWTVEAWIRVETIRPGQPAYIIGKGRTHSQRFSRDNQNWSMRVIGGEGGTAKLGFLFTSVSASGEKHWHRWNSHSSFRISTGWHHVALAYEFGKPETMRGWLDGLPTEGVWDVDGMTTDPPVVDDDDVWIGSSLNGNPGNSFQGWIDMVALHRVCLTDAQMARRFHRKDGPQVIAPAKPRMPELGKLPQGEVLVQLSEGLVEYKRWPAESEIPPESQRWTISHFLLPRILKRYDDWGIRSAWKPPVLLRLAGDVELPAETRRYFIRTRALSRLWIDGELVAETKPADASSPNGHDSVTPLASPPHPGLRVKDYHHQETFGSWKRKGSSGTSRVVLEVIVGGRNQRTETGEVTVAMENAVGDSLAILAAGNSAWLPLTDAAVAPVLERMERELANRDDLNRRAAASSRDAFWQKRHDLARQWVDQNPPPAPPRPGHPVDAFLDARMDQARSERASSSGAVETFHRDILPVLQEHCFRCHGEKVKGGLVLNSREAALKGGESEMPAIVPGDPGASEMIQRLLTEDEDRVMPPSGERLSKDQVALLESWVNAGAPWPAPLVDEEKLVLTRRTRDEAFLRRIFLDLVGVPPTENEARAFLEDDSKDKRSRLIDQLLADERWADHQMSTWLDLLAENPTLINPSLNSTGPFRWFLFDAFRDGKAFDRMVTELILMRGDAAYGGSAGFALAAENDSPYAAKGHILASAFLGIELQCARCHDSPYHSTTQKDLYSLAAMLNRKALTVPATSRVPAGFFEKKGRESLIQVTLKPDELVQADWPFAAETGVSDGASIDDLMEQSKDSRERLAALVTSPENLRFSKVLVNRVWKQFMGAGMVEPVHDWEARMASHPELLDWLAAQFISHDYDLKYLARWITTSDAYQREPGHLDLASLPATERFFSSPARRRLTAEQVVDSLHVAAGKNIDSEELTFVHDGRHPLGRRQSLGVPRRAWMFASLNNERDRPSLSLPRAQKTVDVLKAFGWNGSRQMPVLGRATEPEVLQPGILANGLLVQSLTRPTRLDELADLAVEAPSPEALLESVFLRFLCRMPTPVERSAMLPALAADFETRLVPQKEQGPIVEPDPLPLVTWLNHVSPEANSIQLEVEQRVQKGAAPDPRLRADWREVYEDVLWSLINNREFIWIP